MKNNLVIVESPSKSKTIEKYLGNNYKVVASFGHIRDLATTGKLGLGIDIENNFKPTYINIKNKSKLIKDLKKLCDNSDKIYLATDPDREGEAISWHLKDTLEIKEDKYNRVTFNEITKNAVLNAIENPSKIDMNLVKSQETRRFLDRIIGFRLSKLMQSKTGGKSAGRVQSVALKLIVDREREIEAFIPEEYWSITAKFKEMEADLVEYNNKKIELKNEEETNKVLDSLSDTYKVINIEEKTAKKQSKFPFTTSTLQQEASNKLGFNAKKTMMIAQKLYEGIDLGSETVGLITYMRTDSIRLSDEFVKSTYAFIDKEYGKDYVGYVKKVKEKDNVQDAHEAVRPTSINRNPESIKDYLSNDEYKLYKFIYIRALASLMSDAKVNKTIIELDNNNYKFRATGQVITFDGYLKIYKDYEDSNDKILPVIKDKELITKDIETEQHFTNPPARYTEAKLIKEMEELGIGRPSTYATIIDTLKTRDYVTINEKKFIPTEIGIETTDKLQEFFSNIINVKYTSNMEDDLDLIADNKIDNIKVLDDFYKIFAPMVDIAFKEMEKVPAKETGEICPECGSPLVERKGKFGKFIACSNYPECKYIKKEIKQVKEIIKCPNCKEGMIVERLTKKGKVFYGCNNFPKCKTAFWDEPIEEKCPNCNNVLVKSKDGIKCSNNDCDYKK